MLLSISVTVLAAWIIGKALHLERRVLGSVILVAGVGSSSTLGYSLIHQVFGDDPTAMTDVLIIGELGVILPLFTLGVALAIYFGRSESENASLWGASKEFFCSPIFIALILGIAVSFIGVPQEHWAVQFAGAVLDVAGDSLPLLVAFTIGLMLKPIELRATLPLIALVCALKLIVEPVLAASSASMLAIATLEREILVIEAAMPSGTIAAVLAARYGCDGAVASTLVIATYLLSLVTLPLVLLVGF